jgi:hypothetical protein
VEETRVPGEDRRDSLIYVTNKARTQTFEVDKVFTQTSLQEEVNSFVLELRSWRGLLDTTLCTCTYLTLKFSVHIFAVILLAHSLIYIHRYKQYLSPLER